MSNVFNVIIRHPSEEGDEHTYYGIVFPNRDIGQIKELQFEENPDRSEATFSFDPDKVQINEHFLAILVPVNESEISENNCSKIACKVGTNTPPRKPEIVNFP